MVPTIVGIACLVGRQVSRPLYTAKRPLDTFLSSSCRRLTKTLEVTKNYNEHALSGRVIFEVRKNRIETRFVPGIASRYIFIMLLSSPDKTTRGDGCYIDHYLSGRVFRLIRSPEVSGVSRAFCSILLQVHKRRNLLRQCFKRFIRHFHLLLEPHLIHMI